MSKESDGGRGKYLIFGLQEVIKFGAANPKDLVDDIDSYKECPCWSFFYLTDSTGRSDYI